MNKLKEIKLAVLTVVAALATIAMVGYGFYYIVDDIIYGYLDFEEIVSATAIMGIAMVWAQACADFNGKLTNLIDKEEKEKKEA